MSTSNIKDLSIIVANSSDKRMTKYCLIFKLILVSKINDRNQKSTFVWQKSFSLVFSPLIRKLYLQAKVTNQSSGGSEESAETKNWRQDNKKLNENQERIDVAKNEIKMAKIEEKGKQQPYQIDFYPFAYSLFDECLTEHCWYCLDDQKKHKRCTGCQRAFFCDKNCQILAWKDHKFECRGIQANGGKVPDIEVRLLGRIVARHKAILCGVDKKDVNFYKDRWSRRNIMDIWAHTKNIETDEYAIRKFEEIYERLCQFYDPKAMLNKEIVFQLHCRDFINRHAISDRHYLREIGKGLYLDLCAYDHSCRPNTIYSCHSFIATLRPLNAQVNLLDRSATFYSYIDLLCAKQDRRKLLKDTWYFNCECDRCTDESEHILTAMLCPNCQQQAKMPQIELCIFGRSEYKDQESQLITCPHCKKALEKAQVLEAISAMRFINDILSKTNLDKMDKNDAANFLEDLLQKFSQLLPPSNVYLCKIVQALLPFVDQNDSEKLLNLHLLVEKCIRICYPQNHSALAFHLRNIGIFAKCVGNGKMAKKYLEEAKEMFNFVMGSEHSLTMVTKEFLEKLEENLGIEKKFKEIGIEGGNDAKKREKYEKLEGRENGQKKKEKNGNNEIGKKMNETNKCQKRKKEEKKKKDENGKKMEDENNKIEQKNDEICLREKVAIINLPEILLVDERKCEEEEKRFNNVNDEEELEIKVQQRIGGLELPTLAVEIATDEVIKNNIIAGDSHELFLQIDENGNGPNESTNILSQLNEGGTGNSPRGVKKKLQSKKISPRARTPMYPKMKDGERSDAENGKQKNEKKMDERRINEKKMLMP